MLDDAKTTHCLMCLGSVRKAVTQWTGPSPRGGPPKKGLIRNIMDFFPNFSLKFRVLKLRFLAFPQGPGGFREVQEAGRNHLHLSWYLSVSMVTSYDQKPWGGTFSFVAGIIRGSGSP